jgi:ABC-type Fe3+ transport system permease subunit
MPRILRRIALLLLCIAPRDGDAQQRTPSLSERTTSAAELAWSSLPALERPDTCDESLGPTLVVAVIAGAVTVFVGYVWLMASAASRGEQVRSTRGATNAGIAVALVLTGVGWYAACRTLVPAGT